MIANISQDERYMTTSYKELSAECRKGVAVYWATVCQMYFRLTRVDGLRYRQAVDKIHGDHRDLFSRTTLVRHLPKDDTTVERRIRTNCRKSSPAKVVSKLDTSNTEKYRFITGWPDSQEKIRSVLVNQLELFMECHPIPDKRISDYLKSWFNDSAVQYAMYQIKKRDNVIDRLVKELGMQERIHEAELTAFSSTSNRGRPDCTIQI